MLKIGQKATFKAQVTVVINGDEGPDRMDFRAVFKRLTRSEFINVMNKARIGELTDLDIARDVLLGWDGVMLDDGEPMPFSTEARETLLELWPVLPCVMTAFVKAYDLETRAKN